MSRSDGFFGNASGLILLHDKVILTFYPFAAVINRKRIVGEIRIACYTAPWGHDRVIPAIKDIEDCGFDGIECPSNVVQIFEDRLHVFEEILERSQLRMAGLLQVVNLLDRENADEQVERAANSARFASAAHNCTLTVCHSHPQDGDMTDDEWATMAAIIEEIGQRCMEFGINVCFLPRAQHLVGTEKEIKRLMAITNPDYVKLAVDTAEVTLAGGSPQRVIRNNIGRIHAVRFREASASKRRASVTSNAPGSAPQFGRGTVRFELVSKALLENGYSGWITVDVSGETSSPNDAIANAYRHLVRKSGLFD